MRLNTLIGDTKILIIASHKEKLLRNLCNKLLIVEKGCVTFHDSINYLDKYEEIINSGFSSAKKTVGLKDKKIADLRQKIEILQEKNLYKTKKLKNLKERFGKLSKN
jgi:ABC-type multidrug transport system ATPase subunit